MQYIDLFINRALVSGTLTLIQGVIYFAAVQETMQPASVSVWLLGPERDKLQNER